jgi:signal transduction histidine kinase
MGIHASELKRASSKGPTRPEDWLDGGGEMGRLIRSMDWTESPLGAIEAWPQSLRTTVSLCLASNFPISLAWGPNHIQIYNDGYWPICGGKHPQSMGQDFTECWAAPWAVIGEAFERALTGETSYLENQRMFLDRNGYLEETCFTFSFSPIRDETGGVGGLFHPVTETTSRMLSERRTRGLRDLAARAGKAQSVEEACRLAALTLGEYELDLPFVLFYLLDDPRKEARLIASAGLQPGTTASPALVSLEIPQPRGWPLAEVSESGRARHVEELENRFGPFSCGPYPEPIKEAMALPIIPPGCTQAVGILIAGVSSRLPLNETYRGFYDILAAGVTMTVANARAHEEEHKRAEALAEIDRAKTAFFSNVSHEFRTPLTLMLGPLEDELAEIADPLPQLRRERLEAAHRNSLRLLKLVNSLLDFSRVEAGRMHASYEATDLASYTTELASVFRSAVERANLTLAVDCPALPEPVYVDREMWEKIVLNLLSNAFKHTFEGGIKVMLRWCDGYVALAVADSGVGIPSEALPRVFERFHRVKGAKSRTHEGTGIGLALVQELVSLHGGAVRVESEENKGSTFTVTVKTGNAHLPPDRVSAKRDMGSTATRAAAYVEEALQWLPKAATRPGADSGLEDSMGVLLQPDTSYPTGAKRYRILWADDNADMREYVSRLLAGLYDVISVPDGLKGLAAAVADPPDLILSDVMMPGMGGFELIRELRKDARTKTVPVILLSARAGEESAVEGLDSGADDYLAKPFSARELLARVRTHLELARVRREWAKELEEANCELEAKNKELEAFSYSVSHDLRGPLTSLYGFADLLQEKYASEFSEQPRKYLRRITEAANRMSCLIDDILNLAKLNRQQLCLCEVGLGPLVEEVLRELETETASRKIEWHIANLPSIQCDYGLMKQVLTNLLSNAIKYTRPRDPAIIEVRDEIIDGEAAILVRDNGVGFDLKSAEKLFSPFQRFHHSEEFEGTGVGLATVQRIIEKHKGRIWAHSEPQEGSTFYFTVGSQEKTALRQAAIEVVHA